MAELVSRLLAIAAYEPSPVTWFVLSVLALLCRCSPSLVQLHSMCHRGEHRDGTKTFHSYKEMVKLLQMQVCWCRDHYYYFFFFWQDNQAILVRNPLGLHVTIASLFLLTSCPSSDKALSKQFCTDINKWDVYSLKPPWGNGVSCLNAIFFYTHMIVNFHQMIRINFMEDKSSVLWVH